MSLNELLGYIYDARCIVAKKHNISYKSRHFKSIEKETDDVFDVFLDIALSNNPYLTRNVCKYWFISIYVPGADMD